MFIKNEREKMENYNNDKNTYITRMNKTALSNTMLMIFHLQYKMN